MSLNKDVLELCADVVRFHVFGMQESTRVVPRATARDFWGLRGAMRGIKRDAVVSGGRYSFNWCASSVYNIHFFGARSLIRPSRVLIE